MKKMVKIQYPPLKMSIIKRDRKTTVLETERVICGMALSEKSLPKVNARISLMIL